MVDKLNTFDIVGFVIAIVIAVIGTRIAMKKQKRRSLDGYIVKQLEDSGIDVQQEQLLEFWFYSNTEHAINNVEHELNDLDFEVFVSSTDEDPKYVIRAIKKLIPDITALQQLRSEFEHFAKQHGARYDGWGCSSDGGNVS